MAKSLNQQTRELVGKNYGKSSLTTEKLLSNIRTISNYLEEKYGLEKINNVKTHMVDSYFADKLEEGLSPATLTSHATAWREIADAVDKQNIVARTNLELGVDRTGAARFQPKDADAEKISEIRDQLVERSETSLKDLALLAAHDLREEFGLRAKESLMSSKVAEHDGKQYLQIEGTKGGRERELEIRTEAQMQAVEQAINVAQELGNANGRIIPPEMSLAQMYNYQRNTLASLGACKANGNNMHVMRHGYAQERLSESGDKKLVAEELGHGRESVVAHYVR